MIYQHPLAYLLALQGGALLRAFNGEYDREFTLARIAEVRALLDSADEFGDGATTRQITAQEGYDAWSVRYDGPNALHDLEEPVVRRILDSLPAGRALDAACGTGRHAAYLASRGHAVIGVDISTGMLAAARGPQASTWPAPFHLASRYAAARNCAIPGSTRPTRHQPSASFLSTRRTSGCLATGAQPPPAPRSMTVRA